MTALRGLRVLVVEDEAMLSLAMQDIVADLDCRVAGVAGRLQPAMKLAGELEFDIAVLDINLDGERIDPVADAVAARGIPIVFVTGYGPRSVPPAHAAAPVVEKPFEAPALERALTEAVRRRHG